MECIARRQFCHVFEYNIPSMQVSDVKFTQNGAEHEPFEGLRIIGDMSCTFLRRRASWHNLCKRRDIRRDRTHMKSSSCGTSDNHHAAIDYLPYRLLSLPSVQGTLPERVFQIEPCWWIYRAAISRSWLSILFLLTTKCDLEKVFFAENKIAKNPIFDTFGTRKKCAISWEIFVVWDSIREPRKNRELTKIWFRLVVVVRARKRIKEIDFRLANQLKTNQTENCTTREDMKMISLTLRKLSWRCSR